ncbi:STAS-like domain-containing protein [Verrucomicrobiota bacterium]
MSKTQKNNEHNPYVNRQGNVLNFHRVGGPPCFSSFQRAVHDGTSQAHTNYILDFSKTDRVFPDAAVPVAAYIDLYKSERLSFDIRRAPWFVTRSKLLSPATVTSARHREKSEPMGIVWKFQELSELVEITNLFVDAIATHHVCAAGVVEGFEWCLNEVMDNVLQHSEGSPGYTMMQVHSRRKRLAICIADHGIGIHRSLERSRFHPSSALDALTLAIKSGVTRDPEIGQGNGLWGLSEVVRLNAGRLNIVSAGAALYFDGSQTNTFPSVGHNWTQPGTVVDFRIDTSASIDIGAALGGHKPTNLRIESLETDSGGHQILIRDVAHGTGTRRSGQQVRTFVQNVFNEGAPRVVLDFTDVGMISSSFADEVIGKLVAELGFSTFCDRVHVQNVNSTIQPLIDRAVAQRLSTTVSIPGSPAGNGVR